jgi:hypothetical protein
MALISKATKPKTRAELYRATLEFLDQHGIGHDGLPKGRVSRGQKGFESRRVIATPMGGKPSRYR